MKKVTFYLLKNQPIKDNIAYIEQLTCEISSKKWRQGNKILIVCADYQQAIKLDQYLWEYNDESFIPHNIITDNQYLNTPIAICYSAYYNNISQNILINLSPICIDFFLVFHEIIDFIPHEEYNKKLARNRYQAYKKSGFKLTIITD